MRIAERRSSLFPDFTTHWDQTPVMRIESPLDRRSSQHRSALALSNPRGRKWELRPEGGAAALAVRWASGGNGALRESCSSPGSPGAVALGCSLDARAAEQRSRHHGRELERTAGRRLDDRIVSAGRPGSYVRAWTHYFTPHVPRAGRRLPRTAPPSCGASVPDFCSSPNSWDLPPAWSHPLVSYPWMLSFFWGAPSFRFSGCGAPKGLAPMRILTFFMTLRMRLGRGEGGVWLVSK